MSDTAGSRSEGPVDQLLLEAGLEDDPQLRPALQELRALAGDAPAPSGAVAALMAPAQAVAVRPEVVQPGEIRQPAEAQPRDELAARRRAKRRIALTTLSVAASLGAGGAVAAASDQGIRDSFIQLNQVITSFVTGSGAAPAGHRVEEPAAPPPQVPASPAPAPALPGTAPAPAPADEAPAVPPAGVPATAEAPGKETAAPGKPAGDPAAGHLPSAVPGHLTDNLGQQPPVPVPGPPDLPLPETLPAVPLR